MKYPSKGIGSNAILSLQDDVLIGSTGPTILSVDAPKEVSAWQDHNECIY